MLTVKQQQMLWLFLARETYQQRGEGFREDWAFHLWAAKNNLGAPLARSLPGSQSFRFGEQSYIFQPFAADTLYYQFPLFQKVRSLRDEQFNGAIPTAGTLGFELLNQVFRRSIEASPAGTSGSKSFRPDWTFHEVAVADRLGPALSPNYTINNGTVALQVFAGDTLFSRRAPFTDAEYLTAVPPEDPLYTYLWMETYKVSGAMFDPQSQFDQKARAWKLGAPLSDVYRAQFNDAYINIQVFSRDTLYASLGGEIARWSELSKPDVVTNFMIDTNAPSVPQGSNIPGTQLTSSWIQQNPDADPKIHSMIMLALNCLGKDADVLPKLTAEQRRQMQGDRDIVCADLVSMCWKQAGVPTAWMCNKPRGTIYTSDRAANYFRPDPTHPHLRQVRDDEPLLPGDAFVYSEPTFASPPNWRGGEYHHVVFYAGPYAGTDVSGRVLDRNRAYTVVSASINSPTIDAFDEARARRASTFGYKNVVIVRHKEIERLLH